MVCPLCGSDPGGEATCPCALAILDRAEQAVEDIKRLLASFQVRPNERRSRRLVQPDRRKNDPWSVAFIALTDAPEWISTYRLSRYWDCHPNLILYYIRKRRLIARKDGKRLLVSKASAITLDAAMRQWQNRRPPAA